MRCGEAARAELGLTARLMEHNLGFMFEELANSLGLDLDSPEMLRADYLADQHLDLLTSLVQVRKDAHLTQQQVADRLAVTQANIAAFERHGNDPKLSTIRKYANAVGALISHKVEADTGQLSDHRRSHWVTVTMSDTALNVTPVNFSKFPSGRQLFVASDSLRSDFALSA